MVDAGQRDYFPELLDSDIELLRNYVKNNTTRGHGCLMETAVTLGLRPDLVDLSRVNDVSGTSTHVFDHLTDEGFYSPHTWMASYPNSLQSDYHDGNNERVGRSIVKYAVDKMAHAFKVLKDDTALNEYHQAWLAKQ